MIWMTETLTCQQCGQSFERVRVRGQKPRKCPSCRPVKAARAVPQVEVAAAPPQVESAVAQPVVEERPGGFSVFAPAEWQS